MKLFQHTLFWLLVAISFQIAAEESRKINFAVLGLKNGSGVDVGETDILADRLRVNLFRTGRVVMMERSQMDEILKEQGFQASGACNDAECAVEMGQLLGVERVVSGSIGKLGSLFLVNLRVIDVQTAKILTVVSKDISGGIEGVVKVLPDLAEKLVDDVKGDGSPVKVTPVPPVVEEEPQPAKEETIVEKEVVKTEFTAESPGKKSSNSKNKNKGGIRLYFMLNPGKMDVDHHSTSTYNSIYNYTETEWLNEKWANNYYTNLYALDSSRYDERKFRAALQFVIPIGEFVAIEVGPGFRYYRREVYIYNEFLNSNSELFEPTNMTEDISHKFNIFTPNIPLSVNFTKRFHPVKINAGFVVDFNFNILKFKYEHDFEPYSSYYTDETYKDVAFDFNVSFGPRVGAEILIGSKVSFGFDYIFKFDKMETSTLNTNDEILSFEDFKFTMSKSMLVFSFNLYK